MPTRPKKIKLKTKKRNPLGSAKYNHQHRKDRAALIEDQPLCIRCKRAWSQHAHSPSHHMIEGDLQMLCVACHIEVHQEDND